MVALGPPLKRPTSMLVVQPVARRAWRGGQDWCADEFSQEEPTTRGAGLVYPIEDDHEPTTERALRVYRGGLWGSSPRSACLADRGGGSPGGRIFSLGLRVSTAAP